MNTKLFDIDIDKMRFDWKELAGKKLVVNVTEGSGCQVVSLHDVETGMVYVVHVGKTE